MEKETSEIVRKTIAALESTISDFDKSAKNPDDIDDKVEKYRTLHLLLTDWSADFEEREDDEGFAERIERIRQFIDICQVLG